MALPKKKFNINVNPPNVGIERLKYGSERVEELIKKSNTNTDYLPKPIHIEDIEWEVKELFDVGNLQTTIDGKIVPAIYLDNDRWGEFQKTWKLMDEDKNVPTPYITIVNSNMGKGTRLGERSNVAQQRKFRYVDVPITDEGQVVYLRYKSPEPTNIDINFDIRFFTKYRVDLNEFDELLMTKFNSMQNYIFVHNHPMPIYIETVESEDTVDNIDDDRFFVRQYNFLCKGYILKGDDFEITKTSRKPRFGIDLS